MRSQALLVDLDDTIIDDTGAVDAAWRQAIATHCRELDVAAVIKSVTEVRVWYWSDPARHATGRMDLVGTWTWIVAEALRRCGVEDLDRARRIANDHHDHRRASQVLLPGAVEALERLRRAGIRLALLTNGGPQSQRPKIERFDLARHFDHICIEGEFGCGKPDERVYRDAMTALGSTPATTWMVGDNLEWDVAAPMRLGITGVWIDRHAHGVPEGRDVRPDRIVQALAELPRLLLDP